MCSMPPRRFASAVCSGRRSGQTVPWTGPGAARALDSFTGSRRRAEIVGEARGVLVMDDYAHHPTAIRKTLEGIKTFHPKRRIVVDFMSHTYSRTQALLAEFGRCFGPADLVILQRSTLPRANPIRTASAAAICWQSRESRATTSVYFEEPLDALPYLLNELRAGDLFLTMGAGDNWKLGRAALRALQETA